MVLGFKQQFPWATKDSPAPTNFREKILAGVRSQICDWSYDGFPMVHKNNGGIYCGSPKIHTMREDPYNRWKAGRKIEMVYRGAGYKIIDHFNKGIPELEVCTGVQKIKLWLTGSLGEVGDNGKREQIIRIHAIVDGKRIDNPERIIPNDGFEDIIQFNRWFTKPWEGKIIHWTDYRY